MSSLLRRVSHGSSLTAPPLTPSKAAEAGIPDQLADRIVILAAAVGANSSEPISDPLTLLRFYNACNDVDEAAAKYRRALRWRANCSISEIMSAYGRGEEYTQAGGRVADATCWAWERCPNSSTAQLAARHVAFARLGAESSAGEPVLLWRIRANDHDSFARDGLHDVVVRSYIAHVEDTFQLLRALSLQRKCIVRARFVIDVQGCGLRSLSYLPTLREATTIGQLYFPDITASVTIVRAPAVAAYMYKLVQIFLPTSMQRKIRILGDDFEQGLVSHAGVEMSSMPAFLGGGNHDYKLS